MKDLNDIKYFSSWWAILFIFFSLNLIPIPFAFVVNSKQGGCRAEGDQGWPVEIAQQQAQHQQADDGHHAGSDQ